MKILYIEWKSFGKEDIKEAFEILGHELAVMPYSSGDVYHDEKLEQRIREAIDCNKADMVFSSNYYPPVAIACHECKTPYIAWVYDNPFVMLYSYTVIFETNHIYVFDREQYDEFRRNNIKTVHYLPLAANAERLGGIKGKSPNKTQMAFVGSMYDEEHTFFRRMKNISDYTRGYLEGVIAVQSRVYGCNFVQSLLKADIMDDMYNDLPMKPNKDSVAKREYLFGEYAVNREITARERYEYLSAIGKRFGEKDMPALDLYTQNPQLRIEGILNHGPVDHINLAPVVYKSAKININITLRSIHTGIPLRAFEILGSGGFLLSNYQADFADCYIDGEEYVSFESKEDMLDKAEYYLLHEKERAEIARNGFERTLREHTYINRLEIMLDDLRCETE